MSEAQLKERERIAVELLQSGKTGKDTHAILKNMGLMNKYSASYFARLRKRYGIKMDKKESMAFAREKRAEKLQERNGTQHPLPRDIFLPHAKTERVQAWLEKKRRDLVADMQDLGVSSLTIYTDGRMKVELIEQLEMGAFTDA